VTHSELEDTTFGGLFDAPRSSPTQTDQPRVVVPDQPSLIAMSVEALERLLAQLMAEHEAVTPEELLERPMLDGSLRTSSVFMLALIVRIGNSIGQKLVKASDLDDSRRLQTLRGTAEVLKELLTRMEVAQ